MRVRIPYILFFLLLYGCSSTDNDHLTIAVAANMQYAMGELVTEFTHETGIKCKTIIGSSGKLTAQIQQGAPYDIFVSADVTYPTSLYESGKTTSKPHIYAHGVLVLWSVRKGIQPGIEVLKSGQVKHIAIANPETAPYGRAAIQVLDQYGIQDIVREKLVYGESISQTSQFIYSGSAEIGFTAKSVVLSPEMEGTGSWTEVDPLTYEPIAQAVVILKNDDEKRTESAQKFLDFMLSSGGKNILRKFGYLTSTN